MSNKKPVYASVTINDGSPNEMNIEGWIIPDFDENHIPIICIQPAITYDPDGITFDFPLVDVTHIYPTQPTQHQMGTQPGAVQIPLPAGSDVSKIAEQVQKMLQNSSDES